jgi:hypothetical protein
MANILENARKSGRFGFLKQVQEVSRVCTATVQSIGLSSNGLRNDARCPAPRLASASSSSGPAVWQLLSEAQDNGKIKPHRRAADVADKFSDLYLNAFAAHEPRPRRRTPETRGRERSSASASSGGPSSQPEGASDPDSDGGPSSLRRMRYSDSDSAASTWSGPDLGTDDPDATVESKPRPCAA